MPLVARQPVRFGPFELDVHAGELYNHGLKLKLQGHPIQILAMLLERPGELITREEIRQKLWPSESETFVDFEHGLNTAVRQLRKALGDEAETPQYIETLPRRGYRFVGEIWAEGASQPSTAASALSASPASQAEAMPSRLRSAAALAIAGSAIVVVAGLLIYWSVLRPATLVVFGAKQLTFTGDVALITVLHGGPIATAIQTDGMRVYYQRESQQRIYSVPVEGGEEHALAVDLHQPLLLHISPDGSKLLVRDYIGLSGKAESRIWLVPTNGSPARPLGEIEGSFAGWSPDGKAIAFAKGNAFYITLDEGHSYRKVFDVPGVAGFIRWNPNGRQLRFSVSDPKAGTSSLWEGEIGKSARPFLSKSQVSGSLCCGDWTRDGRYFYFSRFDNERFDYWYIDESGFGLRRREPVSLAAGSFDVPAATASPLGNTLFIIGNQFSTKLQRFDLQTRQISNFLEEFNGVAPTFSSDGKWMVVVQPRNNQRVLWRGRVDGREWLQLTDPKLLVFYGRYSPDGRRIVLMGKWPNSPWKLYLVSHEGGSVDELNAPIESQADPNWAPDGESIIFGQPPRYFAEPDVPRAIYRYYLKTNSLVKLAQTQGWFSPRLSRDGRQLLALSIDEHRLAVYDIASQLWQVLMEEPEHRIGSPAWSLDGAWAFANIYDRRTLVRVRLRDGYREEVLSFPEITGSPDCGMLDLDPDGAALINCFQASSDVYALKFKN